MSQTLNDIEAVLNYKNAGKEAKNERQKILDDMKRASAEKTNLVKKALAAQRARFGAGGADKNMSTDAVLKRLESETAEPFEEKLRDAKNRMSKIKSPSKFNLLKHFIAKIGGLVVE